MIIKFEQTVDKPCGEERFTFYKIIVNWPLIPCVNDSININQNNVNINGKVTHVIWFDNEVKIIVDSYDICKY